MKEKAAARTMDESMEITPEEPEDLTELEADEINLEQIAKRHDWREILRDIVKKEDMDPWDIKVSKIVKEYIGTVQKLDKMDYRVPANALLASSILLREKSNSWTIKEGEEEEEESIWDNIPTTPDQIPPPREEIPEPKPKKRNTKRKVSVDELIGAVDQVIQKEKKKAREKAKSKEPMETQQNLVPDQLIELAKENTDNFDEKIKETEEIIEQKIDGENLTSFDKIVKPGEDSLGMIKTLISLLHLASKGKVSIWQEEVFGEIFIHYIGEEENASEENS